MDAGRKLDSEVAVHVMGWQRHLTECNDDQYVVAPQGWSDWSSTRWWGRSVNELVPPYSTDIAAAWQVVERLWAMGWTVHIAMDLVMGYSVALERRGTSVLESDDMSVEVAICRAGLTAHATERVAYADPASSESP